MSQVSLSDEWVPEFELRSSGFSASTFINEPSHQR